MMASILCAPTERADAQGAWDKVHGLQAADYPLGKCPAILGRRKSCQFARTDGHRTMPLVRSKLVAEYGTLAANPAFPSPFTPKPIRAANLAPI